jgi:hypothetical protein
VVKRPKKDDQNNPSPQKRPGARAQTNAVRRITWRFSLFDHGGPWPLHGIGDNDHKDLLEKLGVFEQSRVDELVGARGLKNIPVENVISKAQRRLEELKLDDQDLWELHIKGEPRMWCIRDGEVLSLLWWDPSHEVCPSTLRNT